MSTDTVPEHHGQHVERCGPCNGWRYDRLQERKAAAQAAGEDPNRVVEADDAWNWQAADDDGSDADGKFTAKVLGRCFKGSQGAFIEGMATPGSLSVTNFLIGTWLGAKNPGLARRLRKGLVRGSSKATGMPAEHFEKQIKEMMEELEGIMREEGAD